MTNQAQNDKNNNNEEGDERKNKKVDFTDLKIDLAQMETETTVPAYIQVHPLHALLYNAYRETIWLWPCAFVTLMPPFFFIL